jgi:hypothetical protein
MILTQVSLEVPGVTRFAAPASGPGLIATFGYYVVRPRSKREPRVNNIDNSTNAFREKRGKIEDMLLGVGFMMDATHVHTCRFWTSALMDNSTNPRSIPQPTASDSQSSTKLKKHYPTTLGLENLNLLGNLRKSSSQSQKAQPAKEPQSIDISDEALTSSVSPPSSWGVGRSKTMPRMTMRRTSSLEADAILAPLPRDKVAGMRRWILSLAVVNFDLDLG